MGPHSSRRAVHGGDDRQLTVQDGWHQLQLTLEHHATGLTDDRFRSAVRSRSRLPIDADVSPRTEKLGAGGSDDYRPGLKTTVQAVEQPGHTVPHDR